MQFWRYAILTYLLTYIHTYLLTPWSRVLFEKLTGSAASQEIPPFFWNPKVHHRTHKCPPPVRIVSQLHPVVTTPAYFLKIHLNIILPSASGSPQWPLSLRFYCYIFFLLALPPPLGVVFYSPLACFRLLVYEVS